MNTTSFTFADAASGTGMLKSSILSAIKSCRLSGARGEFGQLRIEAEELHRELAETCTRASLAEQRVADLTALLDDMREQRDRWQAQADRLSSVFDRSAKEGTPMVAMAALDAGWRPPSNYPRAGHS
jgi:hypothetical protein